MPTDTTDSLRKARVARIWQGRTTAARADEYERYVYDSGIRKIAATAGNLGVQLMRYAKGDVVELYNHFPESVSQDNQ